MARYAASCGPQFNEVKTESWDRVARGSQEWWKTYENAAQTVSDHLIELAKINPNSTVLDIATGIGKPAVTAARLSYYAIK